MDITVAPGARVLIRDEEWLVRRVDPSNDGGDLLICDGVSELVRGRSAQFLTRLEERVDVLDPAKTELVADNSNAFNASMLYIESVLRRNLPNDEAIRLGHRAVMNLVPYQLDPALQALAQPRQRILIADSTGLGKTLEAGILATELIQRGRGARILVITLKSMLTQFQKEFWSRFSIPLVRLDSTGLAAVRNRIPANHNPFNFYDRTIISIDTLKNNLEYRNYLENAWWDIIIIDECHNVAARAQESGLSRRARLARLLSTRSDTLILLSATPHDGSARSFASLMSLLDPTAISDPDDYTPEDYRDKGLVIRRFKKDIRDQVESDFKDRITSVHRAQATLAEEQAFEALLEIPFTQAGKRQSGRQHELQRVGAQKGLFSSPMAALQSTINRIATLDSRVQPTDDERAERDALQYFMTRLKAIEPGQFGKYQRLLQLLRDAAYGWSSKQSDDRLVIFSERIETLNFLQRHLNDDLSLKDNQIAVLHGGLGDTEQQALVERFGRSEDPIRVLLCSDVASEGLNLHYFCHRLIHFDLPWSLMVFQQRNGRIDRYGQTKQPLITYLLTETAVERIRGDLRILEVLQQKDERANRDLGDPSAFMNLHDPDLEARKVSELMAEGTAAEVVAEQLEHEATEPSEGEGDWLLQFFNGAAETAPSALDRIRPMPSLFADEYAFAKTALEELGRAKPIAQLSFDDSERTLSLTAPADLKQRLRQIPREAVAENDRYVLSANAERVADAIERARQAKSEEQSWPALHYLWPQHPIVEWLRDRVLTHFGRHTAPVIRSPRLVEGERAFVLMGLIPNRKGQPLLVDWQVAVLKGDASITLEPFTAFCGRIQLKAGALPNSGKPIDTSVLQDDLRRAVAHMQHHMRERQQHFAVGMATRLESTLDSLKRLQDKQIEQLELRLERQGGLQNLVQGKRAQRESQIRKVFDDYEVWVRDTLQTEPHPHLQVLAAVCR
ncbi:ATP-dependent helicase [Dyella solisilvae]|uniref:ATP-dependent helicase n=1 Tax=Dyella solisilvae TaxID=1920168 RepID=A0A370K8I2_9GAMM|nr:DEAD/DEAH box helicase [Dyella solisilvae]RDI98961.1 ATP-dependent helicase [Dyella solisilvae]